MIYRYTVLVGCDTPEQAKRVMDERMNPREWVWDHNYGFDYIVWPASMSRRI